MSKNKSIQEEVASSGRGGIQPARNVNLKDSAKKTLEKGPQDGQLEGTELFSLFTANIIKEEKVFTR